jgi:hypothetical protein
MSEPMIRLLADLAGAEPDPARAERTRARCRTRLASLRRATTSRASGKHGGKARLWQPLIAVMGVAYFAAAIVQALRVYGLPF